MLRRRHPAGQSRHIVLARDGADLDDFATSVERCGAEVQWRLPLIHGVICTCPGPAARAAVQGLAEVAEVEADVRRSHPRALAATWRPATAEVPWGVTRIGAPLAWSRSRGEGVRVAVIDTGVDWAHPGLAANLKGGVNVLLPGAPPDDDNGHGTHVAGILAAADGPGGMVGVAPACDLYAVKAFAGDGGAATGDVLLALQWCADQGMQVVNMSFGQADASPALARAIAAAEAVGMVLVAAAGNYRRGGVEYPARDESVLAVTGVNRRDRRLRGAARGPELDLSAPGQRITSLRPGGGLQVLTGTSMAAPHVSGVAALLLGARPGLSPAEVRRTLKESAEPLRYLRPADQGAGLVRADRALGLVE